jgi:hypothetical protein
MRQHKAGVGHAEASAGEDAGATDLGDPV